MQERKKSPSPEYTTEARGPVVAKTDFTLQQQMMGVGKRKDLDEWLQGSDESAATATSKVNPATSNFFGNRISKTQPIQPGKKCNNDEEDIAASDEEEDWMFRTFDKPKKNIVPKKTALDPFAENEGSFQAEELFFVKEQTILNTVADKCMNLTDFMKEMDTINTQ